MLCADQVSASDSGLLPGDSLVTSSQMQQFWLEVLCHKHFQIQYVAIKI